MPALSFFCRPFLRLLCHVDVVPDPHDKLSACLLDEIEHALEPVEAAVIRVGHFAHAERRHEVEQQSEAPLVCWRTHRFQCAQDRKVHRENPSEAGEIRRADLTSPQCSEIVSTAMRRLNRAPIGWRADVPVSDASGIGEDPIRESDLRTSGAENPFRRRRAADVPQAYKQDVDGVPVGWSAAKHGFRDSRIVMALRIREQDWQRSSAEVYATRLGVALGACRRSRPPGAGRTKNPGRPRSGGPGSIGVRSN